MKKLTVVEKILVDLLRIDSVSGNEGAIAQYIESRLEGFRLERQCISKERFNVIARKGRSDVWLVAHMDTVPPFFPVRITKEKIFGRGAVDNKGNIAGAIVVARELDDINFLFTVGEETDFAGVEKADVQGRAIILEPTDFKKRLAQCGLVSVRITASGDQKHSSLLTRDRDNALHVLTGALASLLEKGWSCFNVGIIRGGIAENVVAGFAEAEISVRPRDRAEFSEIMRSIRALKGVKIEIINKLPPFVSALPKNVGMSEPVSFFSELSFFKEGVLFGAGSVAQAHTLAEFIKRKDLDRLPGELMKIVREVENLPRS